jgi:hypothetical protein
MLGTRMIGPWGVLGLLIEIEGCGTLPVPELYFNNTARN